MPFEDPKQHTASTLIDRFFRYCRIDTQADPTSKTVPSSAKQLDLARVLVEELGALGLPGVRMDDHGYVFATLPARDVETGSSVIALFAHMDTAPDAPGAPVRPLLHPSWDGSVIELPGDPSVRIDPARSPALLKHVGEDLITSDGCTLLGSDDKAGVAIMMELATVWSELAGPLPEVRLCFTVDEEIGRGVDHLDVPALGADVAYTLDGSGVDTISFETFNAVAARFAIKGLAVHPGYAKGVLVNPLRIASELIALLPSHEAPETTDDRDGFYHPHTLRQISQEEVEVQMILRDFSDEGMEARKAFLESAVVLLRARHPRAIISLEMETSYRNMRSYIEDTDPRAVSFAFAAAEEMGIALEAELVRGGTDGSRLSEMGLPTPNVFNGGHDYHSCFEWNTVQSLQRALAYTKQLVGYWGRNG